MASRPLRRGMARLVPCGAAGLVLAAGAGTAGVGAVTGPALVVDTTF